MIQKIRSLVRQSLWLRKFVAYTLVPSGFFDKSIRKVEVNQLWRKRIDLVKSSADNALIPRIPEAGNIVNGKQIMHNGIKVNLGSYYGIEVSRLLEENKGVHEPEEELMFSGILKKIPESGTMIELGSFWAFYSMWFCKEIKNAKSFMIEPDSFNIESGKRNFKLNNFKGSFFQYFIGKKSVAATTGTSTIAVDDFVKQNNITFIDMLHSDIQGFELDMLHGAQDCFNKRMIRYIFISTHENNLHYQCVDFLKANNFIVLKSVDKNETCSEDGLIVGVAKEFQ